MSCHYPSLLLLAGIMAAYFNALHGTFQFDDYLVIVDNPAVHGWAAWWQSMPGIRPLLKLSYTANWVSGLGIVGFHLFNLACHAINALMSMAIFRRWPGNVDVGAAWVAAMIFALHPALTEAVTYISGRSVSLMTEFYLAAFLVWIRHDRWRVWGATMLFLAAMAIKETAWTLPFALLLWERAKTGCWREPAQQLLPLWLMLAAALAAMFALPGYRYLLAFSLESRAPLDNLLAQASGQVYLLGQWFLPHPNIDPDLAADGGVTKIMFLVAMVILAIAVFRSHPCFGLGLLWFFLHLLPTNSFLPRLDVANDRQLYLAGMGPALIIAVLLERMRWRWLSHAMTLMLLLVLGTATALRNRDYRSELALWQATVLNSPQKARAWLNLGYAYRLSGDVGAARRAYERALKLDPGNRQTWINLRILPEK